MRTLPTVQGTVVRGVVFVCLLLSGCGSSDAASSSPSCSTESSFPSQPLATVPSGSGKLEVELRTAPDQPLIAGLECVQLVVTEPSTGAGVDGLTITMTPWMPAMGHGSSVTPLLAPMGDGRYVFTNVSLFMPGEWELRTQFSGQVDDSVNPTFNVD
jgi:hypothetical protein